MEDDLFSMFDIQDPYQRILKLVRKDFPLIEELLSCDPGNLFDVVKKMNALSKEVWKAKNSLQQKTLAEVREQLNQRFKKNKKWNFDHLDLFNNLLILNESFPISIQTLYKLIILYNVEGGLLYAHILEVLQELSTKSAKKEKADSHEIQCYINSLLSSYKATKLQEPQLTQQSSIYAKRYACLDHQQRILYRLKLIHLIQDSHQIKVMNFNDGLTDIDQTLPSLDKWIQQNQKVQLFEELMKISCQLTRQYERDICNAKILLIEEKEPKVSLERLNRLKGKFITNKVLQSVLRRYQCAASALSLNNFAVINDKIYLKFGISQLSQSIDIKNRTIDSKLVIQWSTEQLRQIFQQAVINSRLIMKAIERGEKCYFYKDGSFVQIQSQPNIELVLYCLRVVLQIKNMNHLKQFKNTVIQSFKSAQLVDLFAEVLEFIVKEEPTQKTNIFLLVCDLLEFTNTEIIGGMQKSSQFTRYFIMCLNTLLEDCQNIDLNPVLSCLLNFVAKIPQNDVSLKQINLPKLYQVKVNNIVKSLQNKLSVDQFLEVFPDCCSYLTEKLQAEIQAELNRLQSAQITSNNAAKFLVYVMKTLGQDEKYLSSKMRELIWTIFLRYSYYFQSSLVNVKRTTIKNTLKISSQTISLEFDKRYNQIINILADLSEYDSNSKGSQFIINGLNIISSLIVLLQMESIPFTSINLHQLIDIIIYAQFFQSKQTDKMFQFELKQSTKAEVKQQKKLYQLLCRTSALHEKVITFCQNTLQNMSHDVCSFLKNNSRIFNALKDSDNKQFIAQLIKRFQKLMISMNRTLECHLGFQLYNYHQQLIHQTLVHIYTIVGIFDPRKSAQSSSPSWNSRTIIQQCKRSNKDPSEELDKIKRQNLRTVVRSINETIFVTNQGRCMFNNRIYNVWQDVKKIEKTLLCHITTKVVCIFQIKDLQYCYNIVMLSNQDEQQQPMIEEHEQLGIEIEMPEHPIQIQQQKDIKNQMLENYLSILSKTDKYKYNQSLLQRMQDMYIVIYQYIRKNQGQEYSFVMMIKQIIQQMTQFGKDINTNIQQLSIQTSWVAKISSQMSNYGIQRYLTIQFITTCMRLAVFMTLMPDLYQQQLNNILVLLVRLFSGTISEQYKSQCVAFTQRLLQITMKILNLQSKSDQNNNKDEFKSRNQLIINSLFEAIKEMKQPSLYQSVHNLLLMQSTRGQSIQDILRETMDRQTYQASIEADIKSFFLKQLEKEDQQQHLNYVSISLQSFVTAFEDKYRKDIKTFSNIARKFLRKTTKIVDGRQKIFLAYDLSQSFTQSDILKKSFINYQPSEEMKLVIKGLLTFSRNTSKDQLVNILNYLMKLFSHHHLLIPYIMLHPITLEDNQTKSFIDFLLDFKDGPIKNICDVLKHCCLEYKYPVKANKKDTFFSRLLCTKIIMRMLKEKSYCNNMKVIQQLVQVNYFAYLCKIKLSKEDQISLLDYIIDAVSDHKSDHCDDISEICDMFAFIYKQAECKGNLKKIKADSLPAYVKNIHITFTDRQLRKKYYEKKKQENLYDLQIRTADDFYSFAEHFLTPIPFEQIQQSYLQDLDENINYEYNIDFQKIAKITPFSQQNVSQRQANALTAMIKSFNFKVKSQETQQSKQIVVVSPEITVQISRYALPDHNNTLISKQSQLQRELASMFSYQQKAQDQHYKTDIAEEIIAKINGRLIQMNKQPLSVSQFSSLSQFQQIEWLLNKQSEVEFDYNKFKLPPNEFDQYLLANSMKFERLKSKRKEQLQLTEEIMFTSHIARNFSTNSISYMIDTIDQNYQHLSDLARQQSQHPSNDKQEVAKKIEFKFAQVCLKDIEFPDVREQIIVQLIFSLYLKEEGVRWQFMPFLENKKIKSKLVTTLLCIAKDPYNNYVIPGCTLKLAERYRTKVMQDITEENLQEEKVKMTKRILFVFGLVKKQSYYRTDSFLTEEISNEGFFGTKYQLEGQRNAYVPIFQIIKLSIKYAIRVCPIFMENVKGLPEAVISQFNNFVASNNWDQMEDQGGQDQQILCNMMDPIDQYSPFACFQEIYSTEAFKDKLRELYSFQNKQPPLLLLHYLVQSNIYAPSELKTLQLKLLAESNDSDASLMFINKAMNVYLEEQISQITWLQQYKKMIRKVFHFLNDNKMEVTGEPINRLIKLNDALSLELKAQLFYSDLKELVSQSKKQVNKIRCKKEKGIFESAFEDLRYKSSNFWFQRFDVRFVDSKDREYSGHGNGVLREWFTLLSKAMVNLNYALFSRTPKNYYFFSRESYVNPRHLQYYEFIGKLFAFALTDDNLFISPSFSLLLYKLLLQQEITIEDVLLQFEEEAQYVRGLQQMINNVKSNEDIFAADLAFTYLDKRLISSANYSLLSDKQGKEAIGNKVELSCTKEEVIMELHNEEDKQTLPAATKVIKVTDIIELKAGGAEIQVNIDNMHQYLTLTKQKILQLVVGSVKKQFQAFKEGFKQVINLKLLKRFNSKELKLLIEGMNEICIDNIQRYTNCKNVDSIVAEHLWNTLKGLKTEDRALFLWNWTGVDKMPAEGAKVMKLGISPAKGKFIVAHTCFKDLQIPKYETRQQMETGVLIVINNVKSGQAIIED